MTTQERICEWCGATFVPKHPIAHTRAAKLGRFCSKPCQARWLARNRSTTTGKTKGPKGHILLHVPTHPNASKRGYVMEHRLVMEQHLGRLLLPTEVVHHKNGIPGDNRIENLEVMTKRQHDRLPKPPPKNYAVRCPHCGETLHIQTRARGAKVV